MFNNELNDLTITSSEADDYFPNIRTISRGPDSTFLATLRALLVTRMTGGEEIMLYHVDTTIDELDSHIGDIYPTRGAIFTINIGGGDESTLRMAEQRLKRRFSGAETLSKLAPYFHKEKVTTCIIDGNCTVIIVEDLTLKKYHFLQSAMPHFVPWLIPQNSLTQKERDLLKTLTKTSPDDYISCVNETLNGIDLRSDRIRNSLTNFSVSYEAGRISVVRAELVALSQETERLIRLMEQLSRDERDKQAMLYGLECKLGGGDSELVQYFISNKNLILGAVKNDSFDVIIKGYVDVIDEDLFAKAVKNPGSAIYNNLRNNEEKRLLFERLYRALFETRMLKLRVCAAYSLSSVGRISAISGYTMPSSLSTYMPNPHVQNHA